MYKIRQVTHDQSLWRLHAFNELKQRFMQSQDTVMQTTMRSREQSVFIRLVEQIEHYIAHIQVHLVIQESGNSPFLGRCMVSLSVLYFNQVCIFHLYDLLER